MRVGGHLNDCSFCNILTFQYFCGNVIHSVMGDFGIMETRKIDRDHI